jgi:hypothetical protein
MKGEMAEGTVLTGITTNSAKFTNTGFQFVSYIQQRLYKGLAS